MKQNNHKAFESTAFEVIGHEKLHAYSCDSATAQVDQLQQLISKRTDILLYTIENNQLVVLTSGLPEHPTFSVAHEGQKHEIVLTDLLWPAEKKVRLLLSHTVDQNDGILAVGGGLYFMPFEGFHTIVRRDEKHKVYPFFSYEVIGMHGRVLMITKIILYAQAYANLSLAMLSERVVASPKLDQLIVPLFSYKANFLAFERLATEDDMTAQGGLQHLACFDKIITQLVQLKHLDNSETLCASATNFGLLSKLEYSTFIQEKVYMLLKLQRLVSSSPLIKSTGLGFNGTTFKPDLVPVDAKTMMRFELRVRSDEIGLGEWIFMCNKADMEVASKLVKDLSVTLRNVIGPQNFRPPKAYTVSTKEDQSEEECLLEGLQNKLSDEIGLVVLVINKEAAQTGDIEKLLVENKKKYVIFEVPQLMVMRSYFQEKVDEMCLNMTSKYEGKLHSVSEKLYASFSVLRESLVSKYLFTTHLSTDGSKLDISREAIKIENATDLTNALSPKPDTDCLSFHFVVKNTESSFRTSNTSNHVLVFVSESDFSVFPNINLNSYYAEMYLNFQNYKNVVSQERFFGNKAEEEAFDRCFVYTRLDMHNVVVMDAIKSYRLNFVDGIAEERLPVVEKLLALIKSIRGDYAWFFK